MQSNTLNTFQVKPAAVFATYWNLFKQFNQVGILGCEIDISVSDMNGINYNYQFQHDENQILDSELDSLKVGNIVAIAQEHGRDEITFGVLFRRPTQEELVTKDESNTAE